MCNEVTEGSLYCIFYFNLLLKFSKIKSLKIKNNFELLNGISTLSEWNLPKLESILYISKLYRNGLEKAFNF